MEPSDVKVFLEKLLGLMQVTVERIDVAESGGHPVYTIVSDDSKIIIGHQGETLRALNLIVRRAFEDKLPDEALKFRIDVNGYYAERDSKVVREALQLAERARLFKYDIDMRPLNPYERRLVHEALQGAPDVVTESRGDGALRHIVICYRPGGAASAEVKPTEPESSMHPEI
jgi:spoIIIJ-associated protein